MSDLVAFLRARLDEDEAWGLGPAGEYGHDPARVLREVEAKRRIVGEHALWDGKQTDDGRYCRICVGYPIPTRGGPIGVEWPCPTLRLLALPYETHPDFRDEWKPSE